MMKPPNLGEQELEVLRYVTDHAPITVREVAEQFGEPRGLARTTILTVMERLRKKEFLHRLRTAGSFQYSPAIAKQDLMQNLVHDFVQRTLGGSLSPFMAYLADSGKLSAAELSDLKRIAESIDPDTE